MAYVFGVAGHSPEVLIKALLKAKIAASPADIGIVHGGAMLRSKPKQNLLMFLSNSDLRRNARLLCSAPYSNCRAFLFSDPLHISQYVDVTPIDFVEDSERPGYNYLVHGLQLKPVRKPRHHTTLKRRKVNYLASLVKHVRSGSVLNPLMTFIYTLSSVNQMAVKVAAVKWLYNGKPISALPKLLSQYQASISEKSTKTLVAILDTDIGRMYQNAFARYRERKKELRADFDPVEVAQECCVSDYEMRYILSVLAETKTSAKFTDSFDKAKNRKRSSADKSK